MDEKMSKPSEIFRKNLNRALQDLGVSASELARRAKLHQPQVSGYLRGQSVPGIDTMAEMANALGTSLPELLEGVPVSKPNPTQESLLETIRVQSEEIAKLKGKTAGPHSEFHELIDSLDDRTVRLALDAVRKILGQTAADKKKSGSR